MDRLWLLFTNWAIWATALAGLLAFVAFALALLPTSLRRGE